MGVRSAGSPAAETLRLKRTLRKHHRGWRGGGTVESGRRSYTSLATVTAAGAVWFAPCLLPVHLPQSQANSGQKVQEKG